MTLQRKLHPEVWENVKDYLTPELLSEADLEVSSLKVTGKIGLQLRDYIHENKLYTFGANKTNGRKVDFTYSPNFCVKLYSNSNGQWKSCFITKGTTGFNEGSLKLARSTIERRQSEYEAKKERCITLNQIYFSMLKKYPCDLLDVQFSEKFNPDTFEN